MQCESSGGVAASGLSPRTEAAMLMGTRAPQPARLAEEAAIAACCPPEVLVACRTNLVQILAP